MMMNQEQAEALAPQEPEAIGAMYALTEVPVRGGLPKKIRAAKIEKALLRCARRATNQQRTVFYMLWSKEGATPPAKRFASRVVAEGVALRMTDKHPDQKFYVLRSVTRFMKVGRRLTIRETW